MVIASVSDGSKCSEFVFGHLACVTESDGARILCDGSQEWLARVPKVAAVSTIFNRTKCIEIKPMLFLGASPHGGLDMDGGWWKGQQPWQPFVESFGGEGPREPPSHRVRPKLGGGGRSLGDGSQPVHRVSRSHS